MLRTVLDSNIFVRALLDKRSRCYRLLSEFKDEYTAIVSQAIIFEVLTVITRPKVQAKAPSLAQLDYDTVLGLFNYVLVVEPQTIWPVSRDPKDDKILACAREAEADYLVTEDKDLLVLENYEGTVICQPAEFIAILEARRAR